ncbi:invasion protein regulator [Devosia equisanguinis]|uniref:Invasion protein regulator n=1 Tax=Devosia equisanguinis TaxID=2490941 RepID=A0A447IGM2_9HYPH|nr:hypothetical protein [Devosia equisanguinis]VDS06572.1 invasion protein regulator [Devosia equisanguinis]
MNTSEARKAGAHRLSGWQAIANYFQRNPSTVRRWAAEHGLPIHRPAGTMARKGAAVFAYPEELDDWLRRFTSGAANTNPASGQQPLPDAPMSPPAPPRIGPSLKILAFGAAVAALALVTPLLLSLGDASSRPQPDVPASSEVSRDLYTDAVYLVEKRTPDSVTQGAAILQQLTRSEPANVLAWTQLATAYNLMVEYGEIDAATGYQRSHDAAQRALELDSTLAQAMTVVADIDFFWLRDLKAGLARFEQALVRDPGDVQTLHWYASALALSGEPSRALVEIRKAKYADPNSRSIRVSEAIILLAGGQAAAAREVLQSLVRHEPSYRNPYRFLAFVELRRQNYEAYLAAWTQRFALTHDAEGQKVVDAGRRGLAEGGPDGMRSAMAAAVSGEDVRTALEPYFLAHVDALAGSPADAIASLARIETRHAFYYSIDPAFFHLRQDAEFQEALRSMKLPVL